MNPYGGEGPARCCGTGSNSARRRAATTPPALGSMNAYGGEGPPRRGPQHDTDKWWETFRRLEIWVATKGFPSQTARSEGKTFANWWHDVTKDARFATLSAEQKDAVERMRAKANVTPAVQVDSWEEMGRSGDVGASSWTHAKQEFSGQRREEVL